MMEIEKQKNTIGTLYIFLIASTILGCMPNLTCALFSLVLFFTVLLAAYWYRFRDSEDGLMFNHMTYLIGTIWIGGTFLMIGISIAGYLVYEKGDHSVIHNAINQIMNGIMLDESALYGVIMNYIDINKDLMVTASLPTIGPALLYLVYRIANGFSRGAKGYRIANPKSWL